MPNACAGSRTANSREQNDDTVVRHLWRAGRQRAGTAPAAPVIRTENSMIDHIGFPVSDYARSKAFYEKALAIPYLRSPSSRSFARW